MEAARTELADNERELLQTLIKKGGDWGERERAQTILLLAEGQSAFEVAEKQVLMPEAVRERRPKWQKSGFASLPDQPSKWNAE